MKKCGCSVAKIACVLVSIGALNWVLIGLGSFFSADWNVVNKILGSWPVVENIVYLLVGISALVKLFGCKCSKCKAAEVASPSAM